MHMPDDAHAVLFRCAQGVAPPGVALMQLCLAAPDEDAARDALAKAIVKSEAAARSNLDALHDLWQGTPGAFALIKSIAASEAHGHGVPAVAAWAKVFDEAAKISPEASVALYSLGRSDLLDAATQETVALLQECGLLGRNRTVLEIGCGIGRFVQAIAPRVKSIAGLDISEGMLAQARRRCADLPNVSLIQGSGRDLSPFSDGAFDLVLAIDSWPYLLLAGDTIAETNMREAHRVLRDGGSLVIFNYSYCGSLDADRRDVAALAGRIGFDVLRNAEQRLRLWDAALFQLERSP